MPHLIAEQMRGRIHLRHHCSEGVPQIMILEIDTQPAFDFPRRILHTVDGLDLSVWQTVYKVG